MMIRFPRTAAVAALLACTVQAQTVNRCIEGGKIVYSDRPCNEGSTARSFAAPPPQSEEERRAAAARRKAELEAGAKADWALRKRIAIESRRLLVGMTTDEVRAAWGPPTKVNRSVGASWVTEQWIYGPDSRRQFVHFRDGILTSASD